MPLFGRGHEGRPESPPDDPGIAAAAAANGLSPSPPGRPFDGHLVDRLRSMTGILHGANTGGERWEKHIVVGRTECRDAYRASVAGRNVMVANAWTPVTPDVNKGLLWRGMAVCAAELPGAFPIDCIEPRDYPVLSRFRETPTGSAAIDQRFRVAGAAGWGQQMLTPDLEQRIVARDDWILFGEEYLLASATMGPFTDFGSIQQRIRALLDVVAAIPTSVVADHVDHSYDDLIAKVSQLKSVDDALALLQTITPTEREQLAHSDSPLAPFADVQTPEEAMARLQTLSPEQQAQVFAMFERVDDQQGRRR